MSDKALKLACRGCGASLEYSPADQSLQCQYCGTITEIARPQEELTDEPQVIVPLTVDATALTDAVYEHLASGDLTPDHLLEHATFTKKERFYVPVYGFTGDFEARWTASFGYDRQEHYTVMETRTENGRSHQVAVTKTKTVTDWRPVNGTDSGTFGVLAYGGSRLLSESVDPVSLVESASAADMVPFDRSYMTGISREEFTTSETDAYDSRAESQVERVIGRSVHQHAQGDRQKDWHWTSQVSKTCMTALIPICHAVYEFEGRSYNVWVSGSNTSSLLADALPVDGNRKRALNYGFIPVAIAACSAGVALFKFDTPWTAPAVALLIGASYGYLRRGAIIQHSRELRQAVLANRRASAANTAAMSTEEQQKLIEATARPKKSWLANTSQDKFVLPALTACLALVPLFTLLHIPRGGEAERVAGPVTQTPAPQAAQTPVFVPPASTPPEQPAETGVHESPIAAAPDASSTASAPAQGQQQSQKTELAPIPSMLRYAKLDDWRAVDEQVLLLRARPKDSVHGDVGLRRSSNNDGLEALKRNDYASAVQAFERGVHADSANVEVRNNYGYALMKAQRSDDALRVLAEVLLDAPDRTSAWANFAEVIAANADASTSALKLAVRFSANRERTTTAFRQLAETHPDERYRAAVASVLGNMDAIPRGANDASPLMNVSAPSTVAPAAKEPGRQVPGQEMEALASQMIAEGQACADRKQYACAITNAVNALRMRPGNAAAQQLKAAAEGGQAQALRNIQIN